VLDREEDGVLLRPERDAEEVAEVVRRVERDGEDATPRAGERDRERRSDGSAGASWLFRSRSRSLRPNVK
jgi:hypothetical protein